MSFIGPNVSQSGTYGHFDVSPVTYCALCGHSIVTTSAIRARPNGGNVISPLTLCQPQCPIGENQDDSSGFAEQLARIAAEKTDVMSEPQTTQTDISDAIDVAIDVWSDAHERSLIPPSVIVSARTILARMVRDALADAQEAGDRDADGEPIPYPRYRSV